MAAAASLLLLAPLLSGQDEAPPGNPENEFRLRRKGNRPEESSAPSQPGFRGGPDAGGRRFPTLEKLIGQIPAEDLAELRRLQREDPQAFRQKLHEHLRRFRQERSDSQNKMKDLQQAYQDAPDDAAKEAVRDQIATAVKAEFEEQMQGAEQRLAQARARLAEIERKFADQQVNAEQIIADRIRTLTSKHSRKAPHGEPSPAEE
jgi:hypothetical protein